MTLRAAIATVTVMLSTLVASAQQPVPQFTDPANLRGERVKPRDGRELPIDQGARGLEQMLRKLNTRASLMLIVAHPDDEDGGMLTYYSRGLGARVAVLTLTRGEGGQNAMTGDFEDALGLLRTQELLSADRYLGVDQFFGTEVDFGFSKTKEEALKKWTHERVLYDAVRSIRLYRPLVIAAVFIGGVTDGHGQHQVSGQIAQEAFKAAADPTVFPDMVAEGILPWQALKVYARVPSYSISDKGLYDYATGKYTAPRFENYVTGEITTTVPSSDVIVHEGTTDPILSDNPSDQPRTYVQFARIGLGLQKSQVGSGMRVPPSGAFDVAYHLYGSALESNPAPPRSSGPGVAAGFSPRSNANPRDGASAPATLATYPSFFDGIDTSIAGIASLAPKLQGNAWIVLRTNLHGIARSISEAQLNLKPDHPELAANQLAEALKLTEMTISNIESFRPDSLPANQKASILQELRIKRVQLNDLLALALGLQLDGLAPSENLLVNQTGEIRTHFAVTTGERLTEPRQFILNAEGSGIGDGASSDESLIAIDLAHPLDRTYSLSPPLNNFHTRPYFSRSGIEQAWYNLDVPRLRNAPLTPHPLTVGASALYEGTKIEVRSVVHSSLQPVRFVPVLTFSLSNHAQVLPSSKRSFLLVENAVPFTMGENFALPVPSGWHVSPYPQPNTPNQDTIRTSLITVDEEPKKPFTVQAFVNLPDGKKYTEGYRPIGYGDLPRTNYYTPATVRIVPVDLNLPDNHRIAYVPGTGDAVPEALASIDLKPDILTVADLTPAKLANYDTVILGVRTYAAHPELHGSPTQALLDYARNGGNVLVQYQTYEFSAADAPYPLALGSNEKVVDETDPVQLLAPTTPFLTTPNKITPADFNNWVEERGHGFLSEWDSHYTALTETHDPDQDPQRGGLITTNIGKGRWTYCAFALYRQLPEAVPGAFRLFVNLISPATDPANK